MPDSPIAWALWWPIQNSVRTAFGGARITAVSNPGKDSDHLDLFMAGQDGQCWNISRDNGTWAGAWTPIQNSVRTVGGGPITAIYRDPAHLDLFMRLGRAVLEHQPG